ncbi:MAG: GtrA family protein [Clostridiales bacterium]|nr:GtrA family protein [Clostridiales bacterium]
MSEEKKQGAQKLSAKENTQHAVLFFIFSNSAGIIQFLVFSLCKEIFKLTYMPSYLSALTASVVWNFTLNREFTFKSAANVPVAMFKIFLFYCVFTPLSTWWGTALSNLGWNEYLVLALTMCINLTSEFLYYRFVVFRNSINTNKRAEKKAKKNAEKNA